MPFSKDAHKVAEDFIKVQEGLGLEAYQCSAGHWTIGYGHKGRDVFPDSVITQEVADQLLVEDCDHAMAVIEHAITVPVTVGQIAALASFIFNLGSGSFSASTLLKKLNLGDMMGAADQFELWDNIHVDGALVQVPGLHARRLREKALFLG